ncbi:hypothetical protein DV738_g5001, partial [Chaetothyriales sp. CBS 135597]
MASNGQSLSAELFRAIRGSHVQLNRLITARLPLCLPPHTADPFLYASGMTVFAHIYSAIEAAMDELMLRTLHTSGLARSDRLGQDLSAIVAQVKKTGGSQVQLQLQLHALGEQTIQPYRTDLHALLLARPHLILAWSWNMYLAIFNGGRFIRQALRDAGPDYWGGSGSEKENQTQSQPQLRFWEFEGHMDGEDIKDAFKLNLEAASESLTVAERAEVVQEVGRVMTVCQEIVARLDDLLSSRELPEPEPEPKSELKTAEKEKTKTRPDSVVSTVLVALMALLAGVWDALRRFLAIGSLNLNTASRDAGGEGYVRNPAAHLHVE